MSSRRASLNALGLLALLASSGACATTSVRSGLPPGQVAAGYDGRWHAAFLFGAVPARTLYDLDALCPRGWSEIRLDSDEFTAAASLATLFLYSPSRLTIVCARGSDASPPALPAYLPPVVGSR